MLNSSLPGTPLAGVAITATAGPQQFVAVDTGQNYRPMGLCKTATDRRLRAHILGITNSEVTIVARLGEP